MIYLNNDTNDNNYRSVSPGYATANNAKLPFVATVKTVDAVSSYDVMISLYTNVIFSKELYFYGAGQGDSTYYNVGAIRWLTSNAALIGSQSSQTDTQWTPLRQDRFANSWE